MKLRAPCIPLITIDPFFSVWSETDAINYSGTINWTGKSNSIIGTVTVDGKKYLFLGYHQDIHKMKQVSLEIDALSTTAVFENDKISLTAKFLSPVIADDLTLLTRPVSYLEVSYKSLDGEKHDVSINISASEELCLEDIWENEVETEKVIAGKTKGMRIGNAKQNPLNRSGDLVLIDWGYFYLTADAQDSEIKETKIFDKTYISIECEINENVPVLWCFAYDDIESIEYFGAHLKSYWNKDGKTIVEAIAEAADEYKTVSARCEAFSKKLYDDAFEAGGEKYAEMLSLAYRQVIAAHKLVLDENGDILYISKECNSNGCAATVDVSYPSIPLFLLYNPELVKGMMRPIYKYAQSDAWKFDFAPHDVGQYPLLNGQVYGRNELKWQMPVEECGNMLVMEANVALAEGNADFAAEHIDILKDWCEYLIKYGADPENQICTDDFAGHLAHNCNLSLKAVMGIQGMSMLVKMLGDKKSAKYYRTEAEKMAANWMETALNEDGTSNLAFDQPGTYSMKYNMVWDRVWKTKLFSQKFMDAELENNKAHFNKYGMPLDSRADYTKSDWLVWTASMASSKKTFVQFVAPLWKAYNESESRVPMTDWYDTVSGRWVSFRHRTVQGGLFMRVLMNKWRR